MSSRRPSKASGPATRQVVSERVFSSADASPLALEDVDFEDCTFSKLDLRGCKARRSRFFDCRFDGCDLTLASVLDASLTRTNLLGCRLAGINWSEVAKIELVSFEGSQLNDTTFIGLNLDRTNFSSCVAQRASFRDSSLREANFREADLSGTEFVNADLRKSDFRGSQGYQIKPRENRLEEARFSLPEAARLLQGLGIVLD